MKCIFTTVFVLLTSLLSAQLLIDFEDFSVPADSFLNGSDGSGGFSNELIFLPNDYNADFNSWSGWSLSTKTDTLRPGFTNAFSAIAGTGVDSSDSYAVSFAYGENRLLLQGEAAGRQLNGMYVTNNTYAYLSMRDGDAFAKKFGGVTGDDPDFFLLTIKAYSEGALSADSVNFYLADYRFADNSRDYLVKDWTFVDLSPLGPVDSLAFTLTSSDVGQFGMNTPAYFCVDNIGVSEVVRNTQSHIALPNFRVFPNPTTSFIQFDYDFDEPVQCTITDMQGRPLKRQVISHPSERIAVDQLPTGTYLVSIEIAGAFASQLLMKK